VGLGPGLFDGGLVAHAVLSAVVVAAAIGGRLVPRLLSWTPIVWVGMLSYGLYVVHYPIYLLLSPDRVALDGVPLLAARLGATILVAGILHHLVERPVRWGGALPQWQGGVALASALGIVLVLATALPHVGRDTSTPIEMAMDPDAATIVTMPVPEVTTTATTLPPTTVAPPPAGGATTTTTAPRVAPVAPPPTVPGPERALRMLVVGDSTAGYTGDGLQKWAAESGLAAVDIVTGPGCAFSQAGVAVLREGWTMTPTPACLSLLDAASDLAERTSPDVVVVFIGSIQIADWLYAGETETTAIGEPAFDARYDAATHAALQRLEGLGAPVLLATLPVPAWDPAVQFPGGTFPGSGPLSMNDAGRTRLLNDRNRALVASHPRTRMVAYAEMISNPDGSVSRDLRPDGMHVVPEAVPGLMRAGLEATLRDAYRDVVRAQPAAARPGRTIWTP
jgi:hypothetical protein